MFNRLIAQMVPLMPERLIWMFSKKYIAGKNLQDAINVSLDLNKQGIMVTIDVLGEYIKNLKEAEQNTGAFLETLDAISKNGVQATISIKPTMFGLLIDKGFCIDQITKIIEKAKSLGIAVCLDMEDSTCTSVEIDMFKDFYAKYPNDVSFVLQAYLYRTLDDLKDLSKVNDKVTPINIRICKGIYREKEGVAFQKKADINKNYLDCLEFMIKNGFYCSIATHDKELVAEAERLIAESKLEKSRYEFQMLYGVSPDLRSKVKDNRHPIRVYVPYGQQWFGYSSRRLKENPKIVTHIVKSFFVRT